MFGGGGGRHHHQGPRKGKSVLHPLKVNLEDIYNGKTAKVAVTRDRICSKCKGVGGSSADAVQKCGGCKGRGIKVVMMQLGPGMYSQRQGPCDDCSGTGEKINEKSRCKECKGKKVNKEKTILEVQVEKGAPHGERYNFHGEADEHPDLEAGDVVIEVHVANHKSFKRRGADLFFEKEITLLQALTGVDFVFTHLDGRKIRVKNQPGEIIKPDEIKTLEGLGMPFHKLNYKNGNLFVLFKIKFPEKLGAAEVKGVRAAL